MALPWDNTLVTSNEAYNFLVVAALQEELNEFYTVNNKFKKREIREGGAYKISYVKNGRRINLLTYSPNKMGMPFNAASIMKIINTHNPTYTLFIGTCAGLTDEKRKCGDVLVPVRAFSFESGKYELGKFLPDHISYETGELLRKHAEIVHKKNKKRAFKVFTDEDFFSGAAVINDEAKRKEIISNSARKVTGLDMEAYSIACINHILRAESKELLVVKGISDFAVDKSNSEEQGNKSLAMKNAAAFAYEIICHLETTVFNIAITDDIPLSTIKEIKELTPKLIKLADHKFDKSSIIAPPFGETITIKGSNNLYVSSEDGAKPMYCNRDKPGPWELFLVVDAGDGKIALRNNGRFVSSENGALPITCNRATIGNWEKFDWIINSNQTVALRGNNNCYISNQNGKEPMCCNVAELKNWEMFKINQ